MIRWIMATLERAIEIARHAHASQVDKAGVDYIEHPLRVMEKGENAEQKIVGVLHDVVEDSDWTFRMLEKEGFAPAIIEALKCVTKLSEGEDYDDFISRVMTNPLAVKVKLYDIEDNLDVSRLGSLTDADVERCKKYLNARDRLKAELIRLESQQ